MSQEETNTKKKYTGKCKRFNPEKGFGFISVDDDSGDVYVNICLFVLNITSTNICATHTIVLFIKQR